MGPRGRGLLGAKTGLPSHNNPKDAAAIPIYFDELVAVLRACTRLRPDGCSPLELKALMVDHLGRTNRAVADKVLAFSGPQLLALSEFVLQAQALVGMTAEPNAHPAHEGGPR